MSEILSTKDVKTRKQHDCFGCGRDFPAGTFMAREGVKDGDKVFTAYLCESCKAVISNFDYGDEFGYGELYDDAKAYEELQKCRNA